MRASLLAFGFLIIVNSLLGVGANFTTSSPSIANGGEMLLKTKINKKGIDGFSELVVNLDPSCMMVVIKKSGSRVVFGKNGEVKFIWLTMPTTDQIEVECKLIHMGKSKEDVKIGGKFLYVSSSLTREAVIEDLTLKVSKELPKTLVASSEKKEQSEVEYKLQLGVFGSLQNASSFRDLPDVHYEEINGLYKYYSGHFSEYAAAKKLVKRAKSIGFTGAFVVRKKK